MKLLIRVFRCCQDNIICCSQYLGLLTRVCDIYHEEGAGRKQREINIVYSLGSYF